MATNSTTQWKRSNSWPHAFQRLVLLTHSPSTLLFAVAIQHKHIRTSVVLTLFCSKGERVFVAVRLENSKVGVHPHLRKQHLTLSFARSLEYKQKKNCTLLDLHIANFKLLTDACRKSNEDKTFLGRFKMALSEHDFSIISFCCGTGEMWLKIWSEGCDHWSVNSLSGDLGFEF